MHLHIVTKVTVWPAKRLFERQTYMSVLKGKGLGLYFLFESCGINGIDFHHFTN